LNNKGKSYSPVFMQVVGFIFCVDIKLILKAPEKPYNMYNRCKNLMKIY